MRGGLEDDEATRDSGDSGGSVIERLLRGCSPLMSSHSGRRVLAAYGTSTLSSGIMGFALPWLTLLLGGGASLVALIIAAEEATMVLLLIPAGIWADRVARRWLFQAAAGIQSLAALALLWFVLSSGLTIPLLIITAVGMTVAGCVEYAAGFGSVRLLVAEVELPAAQSSLIVLRQIGAFGGPALGGLIFALFGESGLMISISAVCLLGLTAVITIASPLALPRDEALPTLRSQLAGTLRAVSEKGTMRTLLSTGGSWNLAVAMCFPVLLVLLKLRGFTASDVSVVLTGAIVGTLIAAPLGRQLVNRLGALRAVVLAGCGEAAFIALMVVSGGPLMTALCYGALMACNTTVASALSSERARLAPVSAQSATSTTGLAVHLSGYLAGTLLCGLLVGLVALPTVWLISSASTFIVMFTLAAWSRRPASDTIKVPAEEALLLRIGSQ